MDSRRSVAPAFLVERIETFLAGILILALWFLRRRGAPQLWPAGRFAVSA